MFENLPDDVESLLKAYQNGQIVLGNTELEKHIESDLKSIQTDSDGQVLWDSVSCLHPFKPVLVACWMFFRNF